MSLSAHVEWSLHCMTVLARVPEGRYVPTKVLAQFHGVPKEYLSKALQQLAKAGLIEGTLGPRGGYRLRKEPQEVTILEVVQAVDPDGGHKFVCKNIRENIPCDKPLKLQGKCAVASVMHKAQLAWQAELAAVTLEQMVQQIESEVPASTLEYAARWMEERVP